MRRRPSLLPAPPRSAPVNRLVITIVSIRRQAYLTRSVSISRQIVTEYGRCKYITETGSLDIAKRNSNNSDNNIENNSDNEKQ